MSNEYRGPVVLFSIRRDGRVVSCVGRLRRGPQGPYAVNCVETETDLPLPQAFVRLVEKYLRHGHEAQQGQNLYYHSGYADLDA